MLVGPSRAGKTPLSFYLAQRGFKVCGEFAGHPNPKTTQTQCQVANYPLIPDEEPPKDQLGGQNTARFVSQRIAVQELFNIDQQKCFALQIKPERLQEIRISADSSNLAEMCPVYFFSGTGTQRMKQFNRRNTDYANLWLVCTKPEHDRCDCRMCIQACNAVTGTESHAQGTTSRRKSAG